MKDRFKMGMVKNKFILGLVLGIILTLVVASAATAVADELRSWRTDTGEVVQPAANAFLQLGSLPSLTTTCGPIAPASRLKMAINMYESGDKSMMPLIIDVRPHGEYLAGHIPHAVWIANWYDMAKPGSLDTLDKALANHMAECNNDKIVVYCHTGHKGGFVAAMLGAFGYNSHNLKYGYVLGWRGNTKPLHSQDPATDPTGATQYIYSGILDGSTVVDKNDPTKYVDTTPGAVSTVDNTLLVPTNTSDDDSSEMD